MSNEKTCGTCVHWGHEGDEAPFRPCQAVVHDTDWYVGTVSEDENDAEDREVALQAEMAEDSAYGAKLRAEVEAIRKHLAVVQDGSGYYAALKTREDFGCVMWKAVEEEI